MEETPSPITQVPANNVPNSAAGSSTMWDSFEHILMFISLYVLATSMGIILNIFVDKWAPGVEISEYYSAINSTTLRGALAALIVSYPLFAYFFLNVAKRTNDRPAIRHLAARKILTYLTLVITFVIVIGYIISIIYNFISGNVTLNSFLHFFVTVLIAATIFAYYLNEVKEDRLA